MRTTYNLIMSPDMWPEDLDGEVSTSDQRSIIAMMTVVSECFMGIGDHQGWSAYIDGTIDYMIAELKKAEWEEEEVEKLINEMPDFDDPKTTTFTVANYFIEQARGISQGPFSF